MGDARATEFSRFGQLNVGQLVRERYRQDAVLVGFTTHAGTVTAADDWGGSARHKEVRPALAGSWEALFHGSDVHLDQTNALEPLGPVTAQNGGEPPETYPFAV